MTLERRFQSWPPTRSFPSDRRLSNLGHGARYTHYSRFLRLPYGSVHVHSFFLFLSIKSCPTIGTRSFRRSFIFDRCYKLQSSILYEESSIRGENRSFPLWIYSNKDILVGILPRISNSSRLCSRRYCKRCCYCYCSN